MEKFIEDKTLHFDDDTFKNLRMDADQVLQRLLANMAEKGSLDGRLTITIDVSFIEETVQNRHTNFDGDMRVVHTPKFQHKVGSVLQIKNEQKGNINCDGMEMVWDNEKGEYILRPITGRDQMSIFDIMQPENIDGVVDAEFVEVEALEGRKVAALPGPCHENLENEEMSEGQSVDNPTDEDDLSDKFDDDYDYQEPDEIWKD